MEMVIEGEVVEGQRLGRQLGFPTANVAIGGVEVESGVYRSRVRVDGEWYDAVTNVGSNPTVGGCEPRAESYIIDFDGDIYGEHIEVELCERLRGEIRFESVEALRSQVLCDIDKVREYINNLE